MPDFQTVQYPAYFMKGDMVEVDGLVYLLPEPTACLCPEDLVLYIYKRRLKPYNFYHRPSGPSGGRQSGC